MTTRGDGVELLVQVADEATPGSIEGRALEAWRAEARATLGLPDAAVIAAGHQSECWHAGILAKPLWVQALAARDRSTPVHVVVDQDGFDGMSVEWPFRRPDGWWGVRGHRFGSADESRSGLRVPAFRPRAADPGEGAPDHVTAGLAALHAALARHAGEPDAAMQGARAMLEVALPWLETPRVVRASALMRTALAGRLLERMLDDPARCASTFNEALRQAPRAARPLQVRGGEPELPVWLVATDGTRRRAGASEVRQARDTGGTILPRAFLMGALARTALADRFVHGLGGGVYEPVTDRWLRAWLGWSPPGHDVVSASVRMQLPLPASPATSTMPWRRAWCDPGLLASGGTGPSPARRRALELIAAIPPRDPRRRTAFRELVTARDEERLRRSGELGALRGAEEAAGAARLARELASRRTWCFALLEPARVAALRDAVEHRARA
jgi:hypothetical protein